MRQRNDLGELQGQANVFRGRTGVEELKQLQRLQEDGDVVGHPANQEHADDGEDQFDGSVPFGVPRLRQHHEDAHIAEDHDGETHKEAHCVLAEVSQHLPRQLALYRVQWKALGAVVFLIDFQGGENHLWNCQSDRYDPDGDAGYDPVVKLPGPHGCDRVDDGEVSVHAHEGDKQRSTVETQLLTQQKVGGAKAEQDVTFVDV